MQDMPSYAFYLPVLANVLHLLATLVWVGGMFFAHLILRPAILETLEPPQRMALWRAVFKRFFPWVWVSVILLLATGYWMLFWVFGGMENLKLHLHLMMGLGVIMAILFALLFFLPYLKFRRTVEAGDFSAAAGHLRWIRWIVTINLILGLIVSVLAAGGRYFPYS